MVLMRWSASNICDIFVESSKGNSVVIVMGVVTTLVGDAVAGAAIDVAAVVGPW